MTIEPYGLRFRRPVPTRHGVITHRRGWLVRLQDDEGEVGLGDAAGWSGFGAPEDAIAADLHRVSKALRAVSRRAAWDESWLDTHCHTAEARYAVELALLDLEGRHTERSVASLLHEGITSHLVSTHQLVGMTGPVPPGTSHLKLKVGLDLDLEVLRAEAIASACPDATLRLDAGGRWTEAEAARALGRFATVQMKVALLEQPVAPGDLDAMARLSRLGAELGIQVGVDEGAVRLEDFDALLAAGAADVVVLKPMFIGGLRRCLRMARRADAAGMSVIITHALESAVGRTGAAHLAAGIEGVHGLSDALAEDIASVQAPRQGVLSLPPGAGLGLRLSAPTATEVPHPLLSAAGAHPERLALLDDAGTATTYAELGQMAQRYATRFAEDGVGPGVHVGLSGSPSAAWVAALHGLGLLGAAVVPLPSDASTRRATLEATRPQLIVSVERELTRSSPWREERFWPLTEPRLIVCSSGTTGPARAVLITTAQLTFSAFASATRLGLLPEDRWLCCLPVHHVGGASILFRSAFYGTAIELHRRFEPTRVSAAIDGGVTLVSLVPEMLRRLLEARTTPFPPHLRALLIGGAALPSDLREEALSRGAPIAETWGMTEAASQVATQPPGVAGPRLAPLPFVRIDRCEDGRLAVAGPLVGERLVTRDLGVLHEGHVEVTGRADEVIVSGGEKIQPEAVEVALREHEGIRDAVVIGVPSPRWGARPVAFLEGQPQALDPLIAHLRARLPRFAIPDRFIWRDTFPRSALGKVRRGELRRELESAPERERTHLDRRPNEAAP